MDLEYLGKLSIKSAGLIIYVLFQTAQFVLLLAASIGLARLFVLSIIYATDGYGLEPQYEALAILGFLLFLRQNFSLAYLDNAVIRCVSKCFGIKIADLLFWEGVFEVQVVICAQIILGPILKDSVEADRTTFTNGPLTTIPLNFRRGRVLMYSIFLAMIVSISSGRTGCSGLCRSVGGETGCWCRQPPNSLGYTGLSRQSILTFLAFLIPNIVLSFGYGLFLNGFYSVGCVVGVEPLLTYYWLIFAAVLVGFGAAALENRRPFPVASIQPPYFAFVNNLKAQSYVLHYILLPSLVFPLFTDKQEVEIDGQNDNFRAFAILASLNMVLQIKLVIALLRLALEIQKCRARLAGQIGPAPPAAPAPVPPRRQLERLHMQMVSGNQETTLVDSDPTELRLGQDENGNYSCSYDMFDPDYIGNVNSNNDEICPEGEFQRRRELTPIHTYPIVVVGGVEIETNSNPEQENIAGVGLAHAQLPKDDTVTRTPQEGTDDELNNNTFSIV